MDERLIRALREDLLAADYRVGAVAALLGDDADTARLRGVLAPAQRVLARADEGPLGTLVRVLLLGEALPLEQLERALPRLRARGAEALGLIEQLDPGRADLPVLVRALLSLNPVQIEGLEWHIISDLDDHLRNEPAAADHVMGVGGATRSLIAQSPPRPVG